MGVKPQDHVLSRLSASQRAALLHVEATARGEEGAARARIDDLLVSAGSATDDYIQALECMRAHARIVLHFHPDRSGLKSSTVAEALLEDGVYRNQFETGLSSGSVSAFPGGERDTWERRLFGGAYHAAGVTNSDRPKYGALELVRYPDGPIPRFGSCYFVLRQGRLLLSRADQPAPVGEHLTAGRNCRTRKAARQTLATDDIA